MTMVAPGRHPGLGIKAGQGRSGLVAVAPAGLGQPVTEPSGVILQLAAQPSQVEAQVVGTPSHRPIATGRDPARPAQPSRSQPADFADSWSNAAMACCRCLI
ncbi:MAG TPA: hypothetical protein VFD73_16960, partial [Gemmatimonadales bacterium]|nr:hypothetical protein [Gemmatimonadales bacterium]